MTSQQRDILQRLVDSKKPKPIDLRAYCFDKQFNFLTDKSLFATAVTSRRAGKTTACALDLLNTATTHPNSVCLYVTLARTNAKKIIWPMLHELDLALNLGSVFNESDLSVTTKNNSRIYVSGAATGAEVDRFLGLALTLAYVDESQSFGFYLRELVDRVLVPACFDNRGRIRLIGTPSPVPVGYFYSSSVSNAWSHHTWTMFENPWIEKKRGESPEEILRQELLRRGVDESDPTVQREIFGRWVNDPSKCVIAYDSLRNHYEKIPQDSKFPHTTIMGIDLGFEDSDAICILSYSDASPTTYLVDELITEKQGLTELVGQIETLRAKWNPVKLVIDEGGLGKKIAEEIRRRYLIPVVGADKARKFENIELLNDSLRTSRFMAKRDSRFANDAVLLEWDTDRSRPDRKVISDRFHSDIVDAALYAFKESPAYSYQAPAPEVKWGTKEWGKAQEEEMFKSELERFEDMEVNKGMEFI